MNATAVFKSEQGRAAILDVYNRLLAGWPVAHAEYRVKTDFGETFALAWGEPSAPPLVLLHGSAANSAIWAGDAVEYARYFRVFALDIPGEPGQSEAVRFDLAGEAPAAWLGQTLDGLGVQRAHLLGMSQGGVFALQFAAACPEQVDKLVLLCPGGVGPMRMLTIFKLLGLTLLGKHGSERISRLVYGNIPIHPEAIAYTKLIGRNFRPRPGVPLLPDTTLARITMPVLLITGDQDNMIDSAKTRARLARLLPRLEDVSLPETGHVIINQAGRVAAFLNG